MTVYILIASVALAEAALYWLFDVFLWWQMLKGKIDSLSYICPVRGFLAVHTSWFPVMIVLELVMKGNLAGHDPDHRAFWGVPAFLIWLAILATPMDIWRGHILKKVKPPTKLLKEIAGNSVLADYVNLGGPG